MPKAQFTEEEMFMKSTRIFYRRAIPRRCPLCGQESPVDPLTDNNEFSIRYNCNTVYRFQTGSLNMKYYILEPHEDCIQAVFDKNTLQDHTVFRLLNWFRNK